MQRRWRKLHAQLHMVPLLLQRGPRATALRLHPWIWMLLLLLLLLLLHQRPVIWAAVGHCLRGVGCMEAQRLLAPVVRAALPHS